KPERMLARDMRLKAVSEEFEQLNAQCANCQEGSSEYLQHCTTVAKYVERLNIIDAHYNVLRKGQKEAKKEKSIHPDSYENAKAERKNYKVVVDYFKKYKKLPAIEKTEA